ncbi:MAG: hypothetical protein L0216_18780 [Planctomycetales bacterium]|nr:hypothetical protein [Planctomycetales bacterium]
MPGTRPLALPAAALVAASALAQEPPPRLEHLWVYSQWNFQVPERVEPFLQILRRAKAAGYTGAVLADYKFTKLGSVPRVYFENVERVKAEAKRLGLVLVPCIFPIGYSNGLLAADPNLAEGMPARDSLFVAREGEARLVPDPPVALRNGDFEEVREDGTFAGWDWQDKNGALFPDREGAASGKLCARVRDVGKHDPQHGHARIVQKVRVSPWRCYRLSVRVKTQSFWPADSARIQVLAGGKPLHHQTLDLKRTQDWTEKRVVFDSCAHDEATVYLGTWEAKEGTLWWDDARIEEVGLLNVLRRDGCPLVVRGEDGAVFEEGKDFARIADPGLGSRPYAGEYDVDHEGPPIRLLPGGRIRDGARLRVSWWFPPIIHDDQVMCCVAEPAVARWCRDQMERVARLFVAPAYFWSHDEIRCLGWCDSCRKTSLKPGALLARNARECGEIHRAVAPGTMALVWSDMWDPNHNAHDGYYHVNGDLAGSWEGLPKEVVVVNWHFGKRRESLRFFAGRGHKQVIAGYYDEGPAQVRDWLEAARGVPGVIGVMYTTWQSRYDDLEEFARVAREFR